MSKTKIADIFFDTETGNFGAHYYGIVAEQGGTRLGFDNFQTTSLKQTLEYLKVVMTSPNTGENFYIQEIQKRLKEKEDA